MTKRPVQSRHSGWHCLFEKRKRDALGMNNILGPIGVIFNIACSAPSILHRPFSTTEPTRQKRPCATRSGA